MSDGILNPETWIRLAFMVCYWLLLGVVGWVLGAVVLVQFIIVLVSSEPNDKLKEFGANLAVYLRQIIEFMCFVTDEKPFPFNDFPNENVNAEPAKLTE